MVGDGPCHVLPESPDGNNGFSSFSRPSSTRRSRPLLRSKPPSGDALVVGGRLLRTAVENGISPSQVVLAEVGAAVPNATTTVEPVFFVDHGLDAAGQRAWRGETGGEQKRVFLEELCEKSAWALREWAERVERGQNESEGLIDALENICETGRNQDIGKVVLGVASGASAATTLSVGLAMSGAMGLATALPVIAVGATAGYVAGRFVRRETGNTNQQMCGEYATRLRAQKRTDEELEECAAKLQRLAVFYGMHSYRDVLANHPGEFFRVLDELLDKRQ